MQVATNRANQIVQCHFGLLFYIRIRKRTQKDNNPQDIVFCVVDVVYLGGASGIKPIRFIQKLDGT